MWYLETMKHSIAWGVATLLTSATFAQSTVTFHADIAPIVYAQCTECHRAGEIGPMPFTTYAEVAEYGGFIEYVTQTNYMPPWTPDHEYRSLRGERFLTAEEKQLISDWVDQGMPEGNAADNPGLPNFPEGSQIGEPDLVLSMPEPFLHEGNMTDQYQVFVIPTGFTEPTEIAAVEVRPGNATVDHHALIGYTDNPSVIAQAQALDAADPNPGYESFGDYGVDVSQFLFGGWVPGTPPLEFPPTIGHVAQPGSHLLLQMHYGPSAVDAMDQTEINVFFSEAPIQREVETFIMNPSHLDGGWGSFVIPPNQVTTFHGSMAVPQDMSLISVTPHCHLLGQSWEVFARSPDAQDTIPLIAIPEWDFNWQGLFTYPQMIHLPAGYVVEAYCSYDNTSDNPFNPSDPPEWMTWGDFTTEEMFVLFLQGVPYEEGDEDISMSVPNEHTVVVYRDNNLFPAWPNPAAQSEVTIGFHLAEAGKASLALYDMQGRLVKQWLNDEGLAAGHHLGTHDLSGLPSGTYVYRLQAGQGKPLSRTLQVVGR